MSLAVRQSPMQDAAPPSTSSPPWWRRASRSSAVSDAETLPSSSSIHRQLAPVSRRAASYVQNPRARSSCYLEIFLVRKVLEVSAILVRFDTRKRTTVGLTYIYIYTYIHTYIHTYIWKHVPICSQGLARFRSPIIMWDCTVVHLRVSKYTKHTKMADTSLFFNKEKFQTTHHVHRADSVLPQATTGDG